MPLTPLQNERRDLKLVDNDLQIVDGDFVFTTGIDAVAQSCRIALQMFQDEWFLNLDAGLPYWDQILGFKPTIAMRAARIAITNELLLVPGVLEVTRLDVTYNSSARAMNVTWQVRTALGETPADTISLATTKSGVA